MKWSLTDLQKQAAEVGKIKNKMTHTKTTSNPLDQNLVKKGQGQQKDSQTVVKKLIPGVLVSWDSILEHNICFLLDALNAASSL